MQTKSEGVAFPPVPIFRGQPREATRPGPRLLRESSELRCELCGAEVVSSHCKRVCLRCGFMTGCSEGI